MAPDLRNRFDMHLEAKSRLLAVKVIEARLSPELLKEFNSLKKLLAPTVELGAPQASNSRDGHPGLLCKVANPPSLTDLKSQCALAGYTINTSGPKPFAVNKSKKFKFFMMGEMGLFAMFEV